MITDEQKKAFKEVLGNRYSHKIRSILKESGIKDSKGKLHSNRMIIQVFNGNLSHPLIEEAIIQAVEYQLSENKKQEVKKQKLLNAITT